jgi:alkylation response protein AidB-like acyl-CoA dehydrogenase
MNNPFPQLLLERVAGNEKGGCWMLGYEFTEEQDMFRKNLREYLQKKVAPHLPLMEEKQEVLPEIVKAMADFELLGPCVTEEYGGPGMDMVMAGIIGEELGRNDPTASTAVYYLVDASWSHVFCRYGKEEGKRRYCPTWSRARSTAASPRPSRRSAPTWPT